MDVQGLSLCSIWRKPGTSQLCCSQQGIVQLCSGHLAALRMQALSQNPAQALPQQETSARLSGQGEVLLWCLLCREEQTGRVRICLPHFILSPREAVYCGAVAQDKVLITQTALWEQWIPSMHARHCLLPATRTWGCFPNPP